MPSQELIRDYHLLPALAEEKKAENELFRQFLKSIPSHRTDEVFLPLAEHITARIYCTNCGNCCRHLEPCISEEEAGKLASLKSLSKEIFIRDFTGREPETGVLFLNHQPCIFFDGTLCTIYENRPASCADFPHLTTGNFKFRYRRIVHLYSICPIVFNTVEQLKVALGFTIHRADEPPENNKPAGHPPTAPTGR